MAKRSDASKKLKSNFPVYKLDPFFNGNPDYEEEKFGVFKFTGINLVKYNLYCFQNNLDRDDFKNQVEFLFRLLDNDPTLKGSELKQAGSVEEAAELIHKYILKEQAGFQNTIETAYDILERNGQ